MFHRQIDELLLTTADLVASMHEDKLFLWVWEFYLDFVHGLNPLFMEYLVTQFGKYRQWREQYRSIYTRKKECRELRNHDGFRRLIAEVVLVLSWSPRLDGPSLVVLRTCPERDVSLHGMPFRATSTVPVDTLFDKVGIDPFASQYFSFFRVAMNELMAAVELGEHGVATRWMQWMMDYHEMMIVKQDPLQKHRLLQASQVTPVLEALCRISHVELNISKVRQCHVQWLLWFYLYWIDEPRRLDHDGGLVAHVRRRVLDAALQFQCWHLHELKSTWKMQSQCFKFMIQLFCPDPEHPPQWEHPLIGNEHTTRVIQQVCSSGTVHEAYAILMSTPAATPDASSDHSHT
jgi:hypothetical protein